jgi:excisionase family DNA binding protein
MNQILQLQQTNATDFKNEIVKDVCTALKGFAETLQNPDQNTLLTRQQTADMLSVSLVTLWDWTKKNIIPAYRIGNKVRYKKSEILASLKQMNKFMN